MPTTPQSQGALEQFHQMLKSMLRAYCLASGKDWVEGLPLVMFAARESVQESIGFSPAELVFGHTVRGPLKLLSEQLISKSPSPVTVQEYVSSFRERLQKACEVAKEHLVATQAKMKACYDQKSVSRTFQPGETVMVLLSVPGSALQTKFIGPYIVDRQLSETNYVVQTPDRRRKTCVCHVNILKAYIARGESNPPKSAHVSTVDIVHPVTSSVYCPEQDGLEVNDAQTSCIRLQNSE